MLCNSHTPKTRLKTVYHQSVSEDFLTPKIFHLIKSHVPFKKNLTHGKLYKITQSYFGGLGV